MESTRDGVRRMNGGSWNHINSKEEIWRIERSSFSVFIDNLPESKTKGWLIQVFGWTGRIANVFISRKHRKSISTPFIFVRYETRSGAEAAVKELHRAEIWGHKIVVNEAKYGRGERMNKINTNRLLHLHIKGNRWDSKVTEYLVGEAIKMSWDAPQMTRGSRNLDAIMMKK